MSRRPRDTNRKAFYAAENDFEAILGPGRTFADISEVQQWVYTIQSVDPLSDGMAWVSVKEAHGNAKASWANYRSNTISLVPEHFSEQTVLHELAHLITYYQEGDGIAGHGREFLWNYLDLTLRWRGASTYIELRNAIREHGLL